MFKRGELPGRFTAKKLFRWSDKKYNEKYQGRLERNWRWQKEGQVKEKRILKTIKEKEEEIKQKKLDIMEQTEEDEDKMGNMVDLYYKLQKNSLGQGNLREQQYHDLVKTAKPLSIFLFFSLLLDLLYKNECGKMSHDKCHISQSHIRVSHDYVT